MTLKEKTIPILPFSVQKFHQNNIVLKNNNNNNNNNNSEIGQNDVMTKLKTN